MSSCLNLMNILWHLFLMKTNKSGDCDSTIWVASHCWENYFILWVAKQWEIPKVSISRSNQSTHFSETKQTCIFLLWYTFTASKIQNNFKIWQNIVQTLIKLLFLETLICVPFGKKNISKQWTSLNSLHDFS